jgi:hypothetical protein
MVRLLARLFRPSPHGNIDDPIYLLAGRTARRFDRDATHHSRKKMRECRAIRLGSQFARCLPTLQPCLNCFPSEGRSA